MTIRSSALVPTSTSVHQSELYFTEREAAAILKLSTRTLQRWRQEGRQGLPFRRFGGLVRYAQSDIVAWAVLQSRMSTSEVAKYDGR